MSRKVVDISVGKRKVICLVDEKGAYVPGSAREVASAGSEQGDGSEKTVVLVNKMEVNND